MEKEMAATPVFLPRESTDRGALVGLPSMGLYELNLTDDLAAAAEAAHQP